MPYLRFLYFITALLALECFASRSCGKQAIVQERERVRLYDSRLFVVDLSDDDAYHIGLLLLSLRRPAEFSASTVQGHPVLLTVRAHSGLGWEPPSLKAKL
jgi:hypothetical protein